MPNLTYLLVKLIESKRYDVTLKTLKLMYSLTSESKHGKTSFLKSILICSNQNGKLAERLVTALVQISIPKNQTWLFEESLKSASLSTTSKAIDLIQILIEDPK